MNPPLISVILTAQGRREYLVAALESAVNQTVDPSLFEIVIVSDLEDLDALVTPVLSRAPKVRAQLVPLKDRRHGRVFSAGVKAARGEILSFLNDDDLWLPSKLGAVRDEFSASSGLGYFKHGQSYIDAESRPIPGYVRRYGLPPWTAPRGRHYVAAGDLVTLRKLSSMDPDFNDSSISVRRSILTEVLEYLQTINGNEDTFFFYAALISGKDLLITGETLTQYRIGGSNFSMGGSGNPSERLLNLCDLNDRFLEADRAIEAMVRASGHDEVIPLVRRELAYCDLFGALLNPKVDRVRVARRLLEYLPHLPVFKRGRGAGLSTLALLYCGAPRATWSLYLGAKR